MDLKFLAAVAAVIHSTSTDDRDPEAAAVAARLIAVHGGKVREHLAELTLDQYEREVTQARTLH